MKRQVKRAKSPPYEDENKNPSLRKILEKKKLPTILRFDTNSVVTK